MTSEVEAPPAPRGLGRATGAMAVGTALSHVTGVVRVFALGYALGSGLKAASAADAYNLANTVPNIVQDLVLGGVLSATFIPVFVQRLTTRADDEAWEAISAVVSAAVVVLAAATAAFALVAPFLMSGLTSLRRSPAERTVGGDLLLLFVPQMACYGLCGLIAALLNARRRFGAPMFAPIANNVVTIAVLLVFAHVERQPTLASLQNGRGGLLLLGLGTTAGVVAQVLCLLPSVRRAELRLTWRLDWRHEAVRTVLRLSTWTFGLVVANQVALLVVLALFNRTPGGVSAYTYAYTFFQLPYGVVAVSVMTAVTPNLAERWSQADLDGFRRRWATGLRALLSVILPAAVGELVLARPLSALLFSLHPGAVATSVTTARVLAMLALGLPGFCLFLYAVRALQAMQDARTAFWLYVLENGVNVALAAAFVGPFGVALSISVAYSVAAVAAVIVLRRRLRGVTVSVVARPLGRVAVASAALAAAAALGSSATGSTSFIGLLVRVLLGGAAGAGAYLLVVTGLGAVETRRRPARRS